MKNLFVPLMLVVTGLAIFYVIHQEQHYEISALAIFGLVSIIILIAEQQYPLKQNWKVRREEFITDLKYLCTTAVFDAIGKTIVLWTILRINQWYDSDNVWEGMPFIIVYIIANLSGELLPYAYHRISHAGKEDSVTSLFLWKIHAIHHLPTTLNWFKTNWMHPINMFTNTFLKYGTLTLMGFNNEIIFAVGVTHVVIAYLSHANIKTQTGVLDYIIVTPQVHQYHHSQKLHEAQNFGNIIPFWDIVFGTYYNRQGSVEQVGVAKANYDYPHKTAFWKQIIFPLNARKHCCTSKQTQKY